MRIRKALEKMHDVFSAIVEDGRVAWADQAERKRALRAFARSSNALMRDD